MSGRFLHDSLLRFPVDDPTWRDFFAEHAIEPVAYDDMGRLAADLRAAPAAAAFLPAGDLFYARKGTSYRPLTNAVAAGSGGHSLSTALVVARDRAAATLEDLRGARLAYTHRYCTTSYFGTALFLRAQGERVDRFFELVPGYAFERQVEAVLDRTVAATMVQESVLEASPEYAAQTKVLGRQSGLPGPVVIAEGGDPEFAERFAAKLLAYRAPSGSQALFSSFAPYDRGLVEGFYADAEKALDGVDPPAV